jgi:serine/threonine protein kinase
LAEAGEGIRGVEISGESPTIEGYSDFHLIGSGGFSRVYRAYQERYDRTVAVKVLNMVDLDEKTMRRFERECALTGRLTGHPHIVTALDAGATGGGSPYLTTDYYARGSLADRIKERGPLEVDKTLDIGIKLCGAIETAHRAGVLHRDIKPQNILISKFGEPALGDFGISTIAVSRTAASVSTGAFTPLHAPPEVLENDTTHPTSDIYSLGSTLYYLLAGRAAFDTINPDSESEGIMVLLRRIMTEPLPPIQRDDVPSQILRALDTAMQKDAANRYQSPLAFGEALQAVQAAMAMPRTGMVCPDPEDDSWELPATEAPVNDPDSTVAPPSGLVEIQRGATGEPSRIVVSFDEPLIVDLS